MVSPQPIVLLNITVPEDLYDKQEVEAILTEYTEKFILKRIKATELGRISSYNIC